MISHHIQIHTRDWAKRKASLESQTLRGVDSESILLLLLLLLELIFCMINSFISVGLLWLSSMLLNVALQIKCELSVMSINKVQTRFWYVYVYLKKLWKDNKLITPEFVKSINCPTFFITRLGSGSPFCIEWHLLKSEGHLLWEMCWLNLRAQKTPTHATSVAIEAGHLFERTSDEMSALFVHILPFECVSVQPTYDIEVNHTTMPAMHLKCISFWTIRSSHIVTII